jgi:3-hydroxypropanoate dehydrogenase
MASKMISPMPILDDAALAQLFHAAQTHSAWLDRPVDDALLRRIYETMRWAPTSANVSPMRVLFVKSAAAKERLLPALVEGNLEKTRFAPVTAILAYDLDFASKIPTLFPSRPEMAARLGGMPEDKKILFLTQNSWLQAGYFILAARALGLDCGPMLGFDPAKVDSAFFSTRSWRTILLVNLGYGDPSKLFPRNPRLEFEVSGAIE